MRIGVTGHQTLRGTLGWDWIDGEMRRILMGWVPPYVGLTSLAVGTDQRFAEIVLESGGSIEVIVPFPGYERRFERREDRDAYCRLIKAACAVLTLPRAGDSDQLCYFIAGQRVVDSSDLLLAVWDGKPAAGLGGTADVVVYARSQERRVIHINPVTGSVGCALPTFARRIQGQETS